MEKNKRDIILRLINELVVFNVSFVKEVSSFLSEVILENWKSIYIAKSELKYSRSLNNIKNNLKKLNGEKVDYESVIKNNIAIIKQYDLDKDYRVFLKRRIRSITNIKDLFLFLLFEFDKYREKIETKKENTVKHNIKYVVDNDGNIYSNMFYSGSLLVFDKISFANEKWLFYDAIKRRVSFDLVIPEKYGTKLSSLEKKRRIYVYAMNDLYKEINDILDMEFDIYYPINDYFKFASLFVSYLYKETFEYGRKDPNLNKIWHETIRGYGANKGLSYYEKIYWRLKENISSIKKPILAGYRVVSNDEKEKRDNVLFKDIKGLVPSLKEIYYAFNTIIIKSVEINCGYYLIDLTDRVVNSMKYMEVDEMVSFYNALKDVFKKKNVSSGVYMKLQKIVAKEIKNRNKKELDYIIKHYLKEDVLFLM